MQKVLKEHMNDPCTVMGRNILGNQNINTQIYKLYNNGTNSSQFTARMIKTPLQIHQHDKKTKTNFFLPTPERG